MSDQQLRDYVGQNRGRYTDEALRQQLLTAGYSPEAIDDALRRTPLVPTEPTVSRRPHAAAVMVLAYLAAAVLTGLLISGPTGEMFYPSDVFQALPFLLVYLLPALLIGMLVIGLWPRLGRVTRDRAVTVMVTALAVPIVILVGMAGFCVWSVRS